MKFQIKAPKGLQVHKGKEGGRKLREVILEPGTYVVKEGPSPNNGATWLIFHRKGRKITGAMRSYIERQGAKIKEVKAKKPPQLHAAG